MKISRPSTAIMLWLASLPASAISPDEFARGAEIETPGDFPIYRFALPDEVFASSSMADLGDMRVFNANGEIVPHELLRAGDARLEQTVTVPFFPLPGEKTTGAGELSINVGEDGTVINVTGATPETPEEGRTPSYLLDLSRIERMVNRLEIEITAATNYVLKGELYASDDLNDWRSVEADVTLASLEFAGHHLSQNTVEMAASGAKYLKLEWRGPPAGIAISSIAARLVPESRGPERRYKLLSPETVSADNLIFDYATEGFFPVNQVDLRFDTDNSLADGLLVSRAAPDSDWQARTRGLFYSLSVNAVRFTNDPVAIAATTDRHWQLRLSSGEGLGRQQPRLRIGWHPMVLHFIARGREPFTLAFGNANVKAASKPIDTLLDEIGGDASADLIGDAVPGAVVVLKGDEALSPERHIPWQRIFLWLVLIAGAGLVVAVVIRLLRQLGEESGEG